MRIGLYLRADRLNRTKTKTARISAGRLKFGSPTWARTRDLRINSPYLILCC